MREKNIAEMAIYFNLRDELERIKKTELYQASLLRQHSI